MSNRKKRLQVAKVGAEWTRQYRLREAAAWVVYDAMRLALDALTDSPSRAVLDLHRPDEDGTTYAGRCVECYDGWGDLGARLEWPCPTVQAVASAHGIEAPEVSLWRRPEVEE